MEIKNLKQIEEIQDNLLLKIEAAKEEASTNARKLFRPIFDEFFEKCPIIESIYWTQYTPYWNDGDECVFGVNDIYFTNYVIEITESSHHPEDTYEDYENGDFVRGEHRLHYGRVGVLEKLLTDEQKQLIMNISQLLDHNNDVMELVFGNDAEIVVTKTDHTIYEYDHD